MTINQLNKKDPQTLKMQSIIDNVSTIVAYLEALPEDTRKNSKVNDAVSYALSYSGNVLEMTPEDSLDKINLPVDEKAAFIQSYNLHKIMRTLLTQPKNIHVEDITSPELFIKCFKTGYGSSIVNAWKNEKNQPRRISSHAQNVASASKKEEKILTRA